MKIQFSDVVVERKRLPKAFQNFKFFVENAFGLNDIGLEVNSLEFYYKDEEESKILINDEESYQEVKQLEEENKINEVYVEMKVRTVPPEEKPIEENNYQDYMMRVLNEELEILKNNLTFILPDKRILKELPEFITVNKIQCDECKSPLIVGPLYKCIICDNKHFCEECIAPHKHPSLKIYK